MADGQQRIDDVLREQCLIPVKHYFLAVINDDGQTNFFSGPEPRTLSSPELHQFFNMQQWINHVKSLDSGV